MVVMAHVLAKFSSNLRVTGNLSMQITKQKKSTHITHNLELFSGHKDEHGIVFSSRAALIWEDYYVNEDNEGETAADRVKREFWHFFKVERDEAEAARLVENYAVDRVKNMMYQARVDVVKLYYQT